MIGERIKQCRISRGLSLRKLASEVGVSHTAISKYEHGEDVPSSSVLLRLGKVFNVKVEYFLRPVTVAVGKPKYRKRKESLPAKEEKTILAEIQEWLERYLEVEHLTGPESVNKFKFPRGFPKTISSEEDIEEAAIELRKKWELGLDPIENLAGLLEDKGLKIGILDRHASIDALFVQANDHSVFVINNDVPGDRQRYNLAHELGHLMLQPAKGINIEKAAHRFAGAFLVPKPMVIFELGKRRRYLDLMELHLLKHKYGLSMQAWVYRANNLGIITDRLKRDFFNMFDEEGWRKKEPWDQIEFEEPLRMERLVLKALAEDIISETKAAELLGKSLDQFYKEIKGKHSEIAAEVCD